MLVWNTAPTAAPSQRAALSRGETRYQVGGPSSGPPVLLVHGMTYPMEVWTEQFEFLVAAGFRVCRYDLYGRGQSAYDETPLTSAAMAAQMLEMMDWVGFAAPATLLSMSNSDLLLAELAITHPHRVRGLVCVAPSGWDARTMRRSTRYLLRQALLARWLFGKQVRRRCAQRMENHRRHLRDDASATVRSVYDFSIRSVKESPAFVAAVLSQTRHLPTLKGVEEKLAALNEQKTPVTLVTFRDEADATSAGVQVLRRQLPRCETIELDGTHMGLLEHPARVNAALEKCVLVGAES